MTDDQGGQVIELTPVRRRRLESSIEIYESPAQRIAYQHSVLCQTCLPYRDPGASTRIWECRQGAVSLALEAGRVRDPRTQAFVELTRFAAALVRMAVDLSFELDQSEHQ